jgi:hypothetical protein
MAGIAGLDMASSAWQFRKRHTCDPLQTTLILAVPVFQSTVCEVKAILVEILVWLLSLFLSQVAYEKSAHQDNAHEQSLFPHHLFPPPVTRHFVPCFSSFKSLVYTYFLQESMKRTWGWEFFFGHERGKWVLAIFSSRSQLKLKSFFKKHKPP